MTISPINDVLQIPQREVQRLLGRCLLRLQQYERLIKAVVTHHEIAGSIHELEAILAARAADIADKTLGTLVGSFVGSCVVSNETSTSADFLAHAPDDVISIGMRVHVDMSAEDYVRIKDELKELVSLRNNLVHHFIDQYDLWSVDGCHRARDALIVAYSRIDQHYEQLRVWAEHMDQSRQTMATFFQSDVFHDLIINGIAPDGIVDWPMAGIVHALREAANELTIDGWTPVALAGKWISERYPEQVPAKYGCSSWRQVLHESRLFELKYREVDGQRAACYRAK